MLKILSSFYPWIDYWISVFLSPTKLYFNAIQTTNNRINFWIYNWITGVIWPWKSKVFKTDIDGSLLLDTTGNPIIIMYKKDIFLM